MKYDRHDLLGAGFAGFVFGLIAACAVMMSSGCVPHEQIGGRVIPVAITAWPSPIKPKCEILDVPEVPDIFLWTKLTDEEAGRIYVTQRQLADLVVWHKDMRSWADQATKCLRLMSEVP